jgi:hypothetical protein
MAVLKAGAGIFVLIVLLVALYRNDDSESSKPAEASASFGQARWVTARQFGNDWPLTVRSGTLRCDDDAVLFETGGRSYAVNGTAKTLTGHPDIRPIWAANPRFDDPAIKKNIGPLIDAGLELCR